MDKKTGNSYITRGDVTTIFVKDRYDKVVAKFIIDTEDRDRVLTRRWIRGRDGYFITSLEGKKQIAIHNYVMKGQWIDHISGNRSDNRKKNLRKVTPQQNAQNVGLSRRNKSGYRGVSWDRGLGKWAVFIQIPGAKIKRVYSTSDKEEAAWVWDQVAQQLFGEYARFNYDWSQVKDSPRQDQL